MAYNFNTNNNAAPIFNANQMYFFPMGEGAEAPAHTTNATVRSHGDQPMIDLFPEDYAVAVQRNVQYNVAHAGPVMPNPGPFVDRNTGTVSQDNAQWWAHGWDNAESHGAMHYPAASVQHGAHALPSPHLIDNNNPEMRPQGYRDNMNYHWNSQVSHAEMLDPAPVMQHEAPIMPQASGMPNAPAEMCQMDSEADRSQVYAEGLNQMEECAARSGRWLQRFLGSNGESGQAATPSIQGQQELPHAGHALLPFPNSMQQGGTPLSLEPYRIDNQHVGMQPPTQVPRQVRQQHIVPPAHAPMPSLNHSTVHASSNLEDSGCMVTLNPDTQLPLPSASQPSRQQAPHRAIVPQAPLQQSTSSAASTSSKQRRDDSRSSGIQTSVEPTTYQQFPHRTLLPQASLPQPPAEAAPVTMKRRRNATPNAERQPSTEPTPRRRRGRPPNKTKPWGVEFADPMLAPKPEASNASSSQKTGSGGGAMKFLTYDEKAYGDKKAKDEKCKERKMRKIEASSSGASSEKDAEGVGVDGAPPPADDEAADAAHVDGEEALIGDVRCESGQKDKAVDDGEDDSDESWARWLNLPMTR